MEALKEFIGKKIEFHYSDNDKKIMGLPKDYVEIFLQSKCTHNIISSSSFSWWGAYLNTNTNKKVIGPSQWFTSVKANNIIPERWQTI